MLQNGFKFCVASALRNLGLTSKLQQCSSNMFSFWASRCDSAGPFLKSTRCIGLYPLLGLPDFRQKIKPCSEIFSKSS